MDKDNCYLDDEREQRLFDLLDAFVPDLVTHSRHIGFVSRLFKCEKGRWQKVKSLADDSDESKAFFEALESLTDSELAVVWLDYPFEEGSYSYIHFHLDPYLWSTSAYYNRHCIPDSQNLSPPTNC